MFVTINSLDGCESPNSNNHNGSNEENEEMKQEQAENDLIENLHKEETSSASNENDDEKNTDKKNNNNSNNTALKTTQNQYHSTATHKSKRIVKLISRTASKQYLIKKPPKVLTLHLKRFMQLGDHLKKIDIHVSFPRTLDLSPFATSEAQKLGLKYNLYGVVEHSGGLSGGHYVAYVRTKHNSDSEGLFCLFF
jgi:ubiquitin carboxyl-terminal hydrolase 16/45